MAYNFKSIADVEVIAEPTKSANVLIEEDGIIKKAPKTTFSNAEWDAIFEVVEGNSGYFSSVDLVFGSYQDIVNKLNNDASPNVLIKFADGKSYGLLKPTSIILNNNSYGDGSGIMISFVCAYNLRHFFLFKNGETSNI